MILLLLFKIDAVMREKRERTLYCFSVTRRTLFLLFFVFSSFAFFYITLMHTDAM
jgi:hypothetical protein